MKQIDLLTAYRLYGFTEMVAAIKRNEFTVSSLGRVTSITLRKFNIVVDTVTLDDMVATDLMVEAAQGDPLRVYRHLVKSPDTRFWLALSQGISNYYHL
jgi:hypothetical protein